MSAHLLPILLESNWYLIETQRVREVLGAQPWLPIPRARAELPGVIVWRGRAVPLVDIARVLGVAGAANAQRARTLIVSHDQGMAALSIDAAREVKSVPQDRLLPMHDEIIPYATHELDEEGVVTPVIDLARLISDLHRVSDPNHDGPELGRAR
ncbi:MAG TPA: chemotaxis protein CheW [Polyangiaceae bacterium]|nr:chemotaxis protein CheW [Polyangiaceae bacterium]